MPTVTPALPYALAPLQFPFPALAALAGRLPLGGGREVALAALLVARLARDGHAVPPLGPSEREVRAAAARVWLASLALPSTVRAACIRCVDATAGPPGALAGPLRAVLHAAAPQLDAAAAREMEQLVRVAGGP